MFDSLTDQMRADEHSQTTQRERMFRYALIAVAALVVLIGMFLAVRSAS
jgi:hypothetical protein